MASQDEGRTILRVSKELRAFLIDTTPADDALTRMGDGAIES